MIKKSKRCIKTHLQNDGVLMKFFEFLGDTFSFLCGVVMLIIMASTLKSIVKFILDLFF